MGRCDVRGLRCGERFGASLGNVDKIVGANRVVRSWDEKVGPIARQSEVSTYAIPNEAKPSSVLDSTGWLARRPWPTR